MLIDESGFEKKENIWSASPDNGTDEEAKSTTVKSAYSPPCVVVCIWRIGLDRGFRLKQAMENILSQANASHTAYHCTWLSFANLKMASMAHSLVDAWSTPYALCKDIRPGSRPMQKYTAREMGVPSLLKCIL